MVLRQKVQGVYSCVILIAVEVKSYNVDGVAVALLTCTIAGLGSNLNSKTDYSEVYSDLYRFLLENTATLPPSGHDNFLRNTFPFTYHPTV